MGRESVLEFGGMEEAGANLAPAGRLQEAWIGSAQSHIPSFFLLPRAELGFEAQGPHWDLRLVLTSSSQILLEAIVGTHFC